MLPQNAVSPLGRDAYFDNAKFLLMLLVVFGHFAKQAASISPLCEAIFVFLYLFHMPCFMFLSGFFAKPDKFAKRFIGFIALYLVCQVVYQILNLPFSDAGFNPFRPHPGLWYLLVMAFCTLLLPVMDRIKPQIMLPLSLVVGLAVGMIKDVNHLLSLSRLFVFLPFFLLGYYCTKDQLFILKRPLFFGISIAFLLGMFVLCWVVVPDLPNKLLTLVYARGPYSSSGLGAEGLLWRSLQYLLAFLLSAAFLVLVPKKQYFFSPLGKYTLAVYVLHLLWLLLDREFGVSVFLEKHYTVLAIVPYAVGVTLLFSIPLFSKPFRWLLAADFKLLYRKQPEA